MATATAEATSNLRAEEVRWVFLDFAGTLAFNDPPRAWNYMWACARRGLFIDRRQVWDAMRNTWADVDSPDGIAHPEASKDAAAYDAFRLEQELLILDRLEAPQKHRAEIARELLQSQDDPQAYSLYPEVKTALQKMAGAGYQLCIVSNFSWALPEIAHGLGLQPPVSHVVTSARVGYRKPHPMIFEAALALMKASAPRSLFVGDSFEADIQGPAGHGFQTLLVDRRRSGRYEWPAIGLLTELAALLPGPKH